MRPLVAKIGPLGLLVFAPAKKLALEPDREPEDYDEGSPLEEVLQVFIHGEMLRAPALTGEPTDPRDSEGQISFGALAGLC